MLYCKWNRTKPSVAHLTVEADSSSSVVSVHVDASSPLIHLGVVVTVERVAVTVTRCNTNAGNIRHGKKAGTLTFEIHKISVIFITAVLDKQDQTIKILINE